MSNYEYSSYSSAGAAGGGDATGALFSHVDANKDGAVDQAEFANWMHSGAGAGAGVGSGSYESSAYTSMGGDTGFAGIGGASSFDYASGAGFGGAYGASAGFGGAYGASAGFGGAYGAGAAGYGNAFAGDSGFQSSSYESGGAGYDSAAVSQAANYTADTNAAWSRYGAEVRGAGLYVDSNPQIIRRQAPGGVQTYTQNIKVRFLQPPPVPPPGVCDIYYLLYLPITIVYL